MVSHYNLQGWLTEQTTPYYCAALRYYDPKHNVAPSYTGNITEWDSRTSSSSPLKTYAFTYDDHARLTDSQQYRDSVLCNAKENLLSSTSNPRLNGTRFAS